MKVQIAFRSEVTRAAAEFSLRDVSLPGDQRTKCVIEGLSAELLMELHNL